MSNPSELGSWPPDRSVYSRIYQTGPDAAEMLRLDHMVGYIHELESEAVAADISWSRYPSNLLIEHEVFCLPWYSSPERAPGGKPCTTAVDEFYVESLKEEWASEIAIQDGDLTLRKMAVLWASDMLGHQAAENRLLERASRLLMAWGYRPILEGPGASLMRSLVKDGLLDNTHPLCYRYITLDGRIVLGLMRESPHGRRAARRRR